MNAIFRHLLRANLLASICFCLWSLCETVPAFDFFCLGQVLFSAFVSASLHSTFCPARRVSSSKAGFPSKTGLVPLSGPFIFMDCAWIESIGCLFSSGSLKPSLASSGMGCDFVHCPPGLWRPGTRSLIFSRGQMCPPPGTRRNT